MNWSTWPQLCRAVARHLIIRPFKTRKRVVQYGFQAVLKKKKKSSPKSFNLKHSITSVNSSFWSEAECVSKFISRCAVSVNVTTSPRGPSPGPSESSLQRQGRQFLLCSRTMEPLCDGPALHLEVFWRFKWLWRQQLLITCDYIFSSMKLLILVGIAHLDAISVKVQWAGNVGH